MKKSKAPSSRRAEIQHLFTSYAAGQTTLPASSLQKFLHKEQMELAANEETTEGLIDRYEIDDNGEWRESRLTCQTACCTSLSLKNDYALRTELWSLSEISSVLKEIKT